PFIPCSCCKSRLSGGLPSVFQSFAFPAQLQVRTLLPSLLNNALQMSPPCCIGSVAGRQSLTRQSRAVPSTLHVSTLWSSGLNSAPLISPPCFIGGPTE